MAVSPNHHAEREREGEGGRERDGGGRERASAGRGLPPLSLLSQVVWAALPLIRADPFCAGDSLSSPPPAQIHLFWPRRNSSSAQLGIGVAGRRRRALPPGTSGTVRHGHGLEPAGDSGAGSCAGPPEGPARRSQDVPVRPAAVRGEFCCCQQQQPILRIGCQLCEFCCWPVGPPGQFQPVPAAGLHGIVQCKLVFNLLCTFVNDLVNT